MSINVSSVPSGSVETSSTLSILVGQQSNFNLVTSNAPDLAKHPSGIVPVLQYDRICGKMNR
jgi:hypothetical protein